MVRRSINHIRGYIKYTCMVHNKPAWIHDNLIRYIKYALALIHGAHNMLAWLLDPYNALAWMNDQRNMLAWLSDQYNSIAWMDDSHNTLACIGT